MRRQSVKCSRCPVLPFNLISFLFFWMFGCYSGFRSITRLQRPALSEMWRWQMSNYRSDIHVSHLWPAWPAISLADAGCERRELCLSIQASGKAAWSALACHPSPVPLHCCSCVTASPPSLTVTTLARSLSLPLTDRWPHWGRSSRMIKYRSGIRDSHPASQWQGGGTEKAPFPTPSQPQWHLYQ